MQKQTRAQVLCHLEPAFAVPKRIVSESFLGPSSHLRFCWLMSGEDSDGRVRTFLFYVKELSVAHTSKAYSPMPSSAGAFEPPPASSSPTHRSDPVPSGRGGEKNGSGRDKVKGCARCTNVSEALLEEDIVHEVREKNPEIHRFS